jgi:hypothetical protein
MLQFKIYSSTVAAVCSYLFKVRSLGPLFVYMWCLVVVITFVVSQDKTNRFVFTMEMQCAYCEMNFYIIFITKNMSNRKSSMRSFL